MSAYISVKVKEAKKVTEKAWLLRMWDGREDIVPASQIEGWDGENSLWVSEWILEKKNLQWSSKRKAFKSKDGRMVLADSIRKHTPERVTNFGSNEINELKR